MELGGQGLGNRAEAGADFHYGIGGLRPHGLDDIGNDAGILQKVLPEAFAGGVLGHSGEPGGSWREKCGLYQIRRCAWALYKKASL